MIHFKSRKADRYNVIRIDSTYMRSFSEALLNLERNRLETQFAFGRFEQDVREPRSRATYR